METNFVKEKTSRALTSMFIPLMLAMILNLAYNLVDSLWIGNLLGDEAMAALTNSTPMICYGVSYVESAKLCFKWENVIWQLKTLGDAAIECM